MFPHTKLLTRRDHSDLTLTETNDYAFAAERMFIPIVLSEIADVAREYPLVFISDQRLPVALTGIEENVNAYVAEDGSWRAHYIPGSIQAYPFALGKAAKEKGKGEYAVVFDPDAPQLSGKSGAPLFDSQGQPMEPLRRRMEVLKKMKKAEPTTRRMVQELRDADLLIDRAIRITRQDAEDTQVTGIQVVDESKFNGLSDEMFLDLRKKGLLPLIYSHLLSMANLRQGVIAGRYPDLAARPAPKQAEAQTAKRSSEVDLETFFADDGDLDLDFDA